MIKWFKAFFSGSKSKPADYNDGLALVKYLIKKNDLAEAVVKLKMMLKTNPLSPKLYLLLADIYSNYLEKKGETVKLIERYFSKNDIETDSDNIELIFYYVTAACAIGQRGRAIHLISYELTRTGYNEECIEQFKTTLEELRAPSDNNIFANPDFLKPAVKGYRPSQIGNRTTVFRQDELPE